MKKQIATSVKAHLIRGALYLLLAVYAIHFALGQRYVTESSGGENSAGAESTRQLPTTSSDNGDQAIGSVQVPQFPAGPISQPDIAVAPSITNTTTQQRNRLSLSARNSSNRRTTRCPTRPPTTSSWLMLLKGI